MCIRDRCLVLGFIHFQDPVAVQQDIGFLVEHDLPIVDHIEIVADPFQVAGDVGADQDGPCLLYTSKIVVWNDKPCRCFCDSAPETIPALHPAGGYADVTGKGHMVSEKTGYPY